MNVSALQKSTEKAVFIYGIGILWNIANTVSATLLKKKAGRHIPSTMQKDRAQPYTTFTNVKKAIKNGYSIEFCYTLDKHYFT